MNGTAQPAPQPSPARLSPRDERALVAVAVQFFSNGAMTASFVARAPQLRDNIGVTVGEYGLLLTVSAVVGIAVSLFAGRIVHGASTRRVLAAGAVAMLASLPLIGGATSPLTWLAGVSLYVFFDTLVDISMNLQGSWISARRHAPVMNRLHGFWSVGCLVGGAGAAAANACSWSTSLHLSVTVVIMALVLSVTTRQLLPRDEGESGGEAARGEAERAVPLPARAPRLPLVLLILAGMFAVVMEAIGGDWATFRLSDDLSASATLASFAFVAYTTGMMMMRFAGDHLILRLGRRGLHRLSLLLSVFGFALAALIASPPAALLGFFSVGLGVATFMPKLYDDAARAPGRRGAGLGAMTAGMRVAHLITPALVGALVSRGSSIGAAIAICSFSAAAGLIGVSEWMARLPSARGGAE